MSQLIYKTIGNPQNPAVLFLPGFMGKKEDFEDIALSLTQNYSILIDIDIPPNLKNIYDAPIIFTKSLFQLITRLNLKKVSLVGYSMGGRIATYFYSLFGQMVHSLFLLSSAMPLTSKEEKVKRLQQDQILAKKLRYQPFETFLKNWYLLDLFKTLKDKPQLFEKMMLKRFENDPLSLSKTLLAFSPSNFPNILYPISLNSNVYFAAGIEDKKYVLEKKKVLDFFPNANISFISNASHAIHIEDKDFILKLLKKGMNHDSNHIHN